MRFKLHKLALISLLATSAFASPYDWRIGFEMAYARLQGVRAYDASKNINQMATKGMLAPSLKLSTQVGNKGEVSLRYTLFDDIDSTGLSSDSDIFDESGGGYQVLSPYAISEQLQEITFAYLYEIARFNKFRLKVGPNLSFFDSNADFYSKRNEGSLGSDVYETVFRYLRSYSISDTALGAEINANFSLSKKVQIDCAYRFTNPPDRDIHLLSLALNFGY